MISACSSSVIFPLLSGEFQFGVRWYTTSSATSLAISGISCTPLAPVPITATFLPAKSTGSLGHWPVWWASPWYRSRPGIDGQYGTDSTPVADTTKRERSCAPSSVVERPGGAGLVEGGRGDAGAELHQVAQAELLDDEVQVRLGLGLAGEVLRPVPLGEQLGREEVAVGVALRVEAGARVAVPVPGAPDVGAGLDQADVEARLTQQVQLVDAGDPGADDDDLGVEGGARCRRPATRPARWPCSSPSLGPVGPQRSGQRR